MTSFDTYSLLMAGTVLGVMLTAHLIPNPAAQHDLQRSPAPLLTS